MLVNVFLWLVFVLLVVACFVWLDKHDELVGAFFRKNLTRFKEVCYVWHL